MSKFQLLLLVPVLINAISTNATTTIHNKLLATAEQPARHESRDPEKLLVNNQNQTASGSPMGGVGSAREIAPDPVLQEDARGAAILDDLVNQLLGRSGQLIRRDTLNSNSTLETPTHQQHQQDDARRAGEMSQQTGGSDEQLVGGDVGEEVDDDNDRLIPYDMIGQSSQLQPHRSLPHNKESDRLSNYKMAVADEDEIPAPTRQPFFNEQVGSISNKKNSFNVGGPHFDNRQPALETDKIQQPGRNSTTNSNEASATTPAVSNSSGVVDQVEAPLSRQLVELGADNSSTTVPATPVTSTTRSASNIQPRSMYSVPPTANTNKTPQHTRPPYASHDQFHLRTSAREMAAVQQQQNNTNQTSATAATTDSLVANTINSISAHLAGEAAKGSLTPSPSTLRPAYSGGGGSSNGEQGRQLQVPTGNSGIASPANAAPSPSATEDKQLQKLANSVSQLVELHPIPAATTSSSNHPPTNPSQVDSPLLNDKFYFSKDHPLLSHLAHQRQQQTINRGPGERYSSLGLFSDPSATSGEQQAGDFNVDSQQLVSDSRAKAPSLVMESKRSATSPAPSISSTTSTVASSMDQNPRLNYHGGFDTTHETGNTRYTGSTPQRQVSAPSHYTASLVNITAPMVLPLSATEAMETELASSGQSAKGLLQQASGFMRPQQQAQMRSPLNQGGSESIYSQPANKFSPKQITGSGGYHTMDASHPAPDHLASESQISPNVTTATGGSTSQQLDNQRMRLDPNGYLLPYARRPAYQHMAERENLSNYNYYHGNNNNHHQQFAHQHVAAHQASGFRSPLHSASHMSLQLGGTNQQAAASHHLFSAQSSPNSNWASASIPLPASYFSNAPLATSPPAAAAALDAGAAAPPGALSAERPNVLQLQQQTKPPNNPGASMSSTMSSLNLAASASPSSQPTMTTATTTTTTTNGFITSGATSGGGNPAAVGSTELVQPPSSVLVGPPSASGLPAVASGGGPMRVFNLTRVEHISAECSNDLIKTVIKFNGTFKGIIYSSGYVRDPSCLYINGSGKNQYEFSIRLNQCGTLNRQELRKPAEQGDVRRRDQVMWNTLSIQYNPIIEQEWDEHFRVSCEYGSDFWKTISFNPFNVETNTGSPVVFTIDPPQCQMEIFKGHGMVGPRQEAISGPVIVGDPLTLLIHMKSEKPGYDILVKNCIAHDGGHQKMQLIDTNGCVVNERFISPFRGTYNDNDLKHITLYSYLKAFRFTGSPVLYIECEIHMCQSSCPPQMCYWRRLSKRSLNDTSAEGGADEADDHEQESTTFLSKATAEYRDQNHAGGASESHRRGRHLTNGRRHSGSPTTTAKPLEQQPPDGRVSKLVSLEVRNERDELTETAPYSLASANSHDEVGDDHDGDRARLLTGSSLLCYRRAEVLAFLFTLISSAVIAIGLALGYCWRVTRIQARAKKQTSGRLLERLVEGVRQRQAQVQARAQFVGPDANEIDFTGGARRIQPGDCASTTSSTKFPVSLVDRASIHSQDGATRRSSASQHQPLSSLMSSPSSSISSSGAHSRFQKDPLISPSERL